MSEAQAPSTAPAAAPEVQEQRQQLNRPQPADYVPESQRGKPAPAQPKSSKVVAYNPIIADATDSSEKLKFTQPKTPEPPPATEEAKPAPSGELTDEQVKEWFRKKNLKLKMGNKERPIESLEQLMHHAGRSYGAEQLMEQSKKALEEAALEKSLRAQLKDPRLPLAERAKILDRLEIPPEVIEERLTQRLESIEQDKQLSPREREYQALLAQQQSRLEELEAKEQAAARQAQEIAEQRQLAEQQRAVADVAIEVTKGLNVDLEKNPRLLMRVAEAMDLSAESGLPVAPEQIAAAVKEEMMDEFTSFTANMTGEELLEYFGEAGRKMMAFMVARMKGMPTKSGTQQPPPQQEQRNDPSRDPRFGSPGFFRKL